MAYKLPRAAWQTARKFAGILVAVCKGKRAFLAGTVFEDTLKKTAVGHFLAPVTVPLAVGPFALVDRTAFIFHAADSVGESVFKVADVGFAVCVGVYALTVRSVILPFAIVDVVVLCGIDATSVSHTVYDVAIVYRAVTVNLCWHFCFSRIER